MDTKSLHPLTDDEILAVARFIDGCYQKRACSMWRAKFWECARRGVFAPYVMTADQYRLKRLFDRYGMDAVYGLRTADVLRHGECIARSYGEPPLSVLMQSTTPVATTA